MAELKDTAIKLFGKTIPLPLDQLEDVSSANESSCSVKVAAIPQGCSDENSGALHEKKSEKEREEQDGNRESSGGEINNGKQEDAANQISEDSIHPSTSSGIGDNHKSPSAEGEISSSKSSKNGEQSDTSVSGEKTLKKPDKILPCPRCNSMDTKFCYFNNYNVNQPRHFCKNCQRYWTAGGTMRNVPVGAGRRKNKSSSALHYRQIMVSETLRAVQAHAANGTHNPSLGTNGTVLTFGPDSPLCNPVSQVLNLSEKSQDGVRNGHHRPEIRILVSRGGTTENGDDCASRSSAANLNSSEKGFPHQIPCFPGHPWPYPWTSGMPPPTFCPLGFPVSVYAAPNYWGCTVPNPWNVPGCFSSPSTSLPDCTQSSSPKSPLGKHSREGNVLNQANSDEPSRESNGSERSVLLPKTLRIDDPSEAAKSSIWATLGIKREKTNSFNGGSLFKGFQSKNKDGNYKAETFPLLQANPAALSRSLNFHEST